MPLIILGVIFAVALGIYAFFASRAIAEEDRRIELEKNKKAAGRSDSAADRESGERDNVIFLPTDLEKEKSRHRKKP